MQSALFFVVFILQCIVGSNGNHPLKNRLKTWETITGDDITVHRQKRSLDGKRSTFDQEVSFKAFERQFTLSLVKSPGIFTPDFRASVWTNSGEKDISLDKGSIYQGTVLGEPGSTVRAHFQGRDLMANIKTKDDTYIVEPSWRHLPEDSENADENSKMIVYRRSDFNMSSFRHGNDSLCGIDEVMRDIREKEKSQQGKKEQVNLHHRAKRSIDRSKKICTLALVADYRFYMEMGNGNHLQTMYYLINLIERVNNIFKETNWGSEEENEDYSGYGFQISNMKVHTEPTTSGKPRFNADDNWSAKELLEAFSEHNYEQCLAHLFTYVDFDKGVLGLAYVGASKEDAVGGVCTKPYEQGILKPKLFLNTGLTTAKNWGQRILTLEADLVTTHELGHNFGAEHDNGEVKACSPGVSDNGNYIMYPAAVSGEHDNNRKFSKCSKHNVLPVLKYKAPLCFEEVKVSFCGNFKVEKGEECDIGYSKEDECCKGCKLNPGKSCSSGNSACCNSACQAASTTALCYTEVKGSCFSNTYCDGVNFTCPPHEHKKDDTPCGDEGKCKAGKCEPFCKTVGMKPCLCTGDKEDYCKRCCTPKDAVGDDMIKLCKPYIGFNTTLPRQLRNHATCTLGYCKDGECIKQTQDVIERVWSIFEHIAPDKIGEFLADNIVGAVLVFSLLFWVPCGCLVNFVDKKREKRRREDEELFAERFSDIYRFNPGVVHGGMFGSSNTIHKVSHMPHTQTRNATPAPAAGGVTVATKAGLGAKEQWNAARERGLATRKSQEKLADGSNGQASHNGMARDDHNARSEEIIAKGADANTNYNAHTSNGTDPDDHQVSSVLTSRRTSRPQLTRQPNTTDDFTA